MTQLTLTVNGKSMTRDIPPQTLLSEFIRESLRLQRDAGSNNIARKA